MIVSGSINNYIRQENLQLKAKINLKNPGLAAKNSDSCQIGRQLKEDDSSRKLRDITLKLKLGKTLSVKEKDYLKQQAPELYRKYQMVEAERSLYSKQLSKARSPKEGTAIHQSKLCQLCDGQRKNPANNDQELYAYRSAAIADEYKEYAAKGKEYHKAKASIWQKSVAAATPALRNKAISNYRAIQKKGDS